MARRPLSPPPRRHTQSPHGPFGDADPQHWEEWEAWFDDIHEKLPSVVTRNVSLSPSSIAANTATEQLFTVSNVNSGASAVVSANLATTGVRILPSRVTAKNEIGITFWNTTSSAVALNTTTFRITVMG